MSTKLAKNDKYFFKSSHNAPVHKTDVILYDVAAKMCQFDGTSVCTNIVRSVNNSVFKQRFYISRSESYSVLSPFLSKLRYAYRRNRQNLFYLLVYFKFESEIAVKS